MTKVLLVLGVVIVVCTAAIAGLFRYQIVVGQAGVLAIPYLLDRWTGEVISCVPAKPDQFTPSSVYLAAPHAWRCGH